MARATCTTPGCKGVRYWWPALGQTLRMLRCETCGAAMESKQAYLDRPVLERAVVEAAREIVRQLPVNGIEPHLIEILINKVNELEEASRC